jgi:hypothetical protein
MLVAFFFFDKNGFKKLYCATRCDSNTINLFVHIGDPVSLVLYAPSLALNAGKNKYNKNVDIIFSAQTRFWNNLHQVRSKSKDWIAK